MQQKQIKFFNSTSTNAALRQKVDQDVRFCPAIAKGIYFPISVLPLSNWILTTGLWEDTGVWDDNSNWID